MAAPVGLFYDANGNLAKLVIPHEDEPDNYDLSQHDTPEHVRVTLDLQDFIPASEPINVDGTMVYQELNQLALLQLAISASQIAAQVQASITATADYLTAQAATLNAPAATDAP